MPTDLIRYDLLVQDALRSVVRKVLADTARDGLLGDHHFYVTFRTGAIGVRLSARMRDKYPDEMTIILQHQFWDLEVTEQTFQVGLSFGGTAELLVIPFDSVTGFFDPSVQFGLKFEIQDVAPEAGANDTAPTKAAGAKTRWPSHQEERARRRGPLCAGPVPSRRWCRRKSPWPNRRRPARPPQRRNRPTKRPEKAAGGGGRRDQDHFDRRIPQEALISERRHGAPRCNPERTGRSAVRPSTWQKSSTSGVPVKRRRGAPPKPERRPTASPSAERNPSGKPRRANTTGRSATSKDIGASRNRRNNPSNNPKPRISLAMATTEPQGLPAAARIAKRSLVISGHRTSVSLEGVFWNALKEAATARSLSVAQSRRRHRRHAWPSQPLLGDSRLSLLARSSSRYFRRHAERETLARRFRQDRGGHLPLAGGSTRSRMSNGCGSTGGGSAIWPL